MRKKAHRRINANNREYDRFYVINYLVRTWFKLASAGQNRIPTRICVCDESGAGKDLGGGAERRRP